MHVHVPSGVWNMPAPLKSSLVGLPVPGLGDTGAPPRFIGAGRADGPKDALMPALGVPPFMLFGGAGEALGLVEGGRRDMSEGITRNQESTNFESAGR